MLAGRILALFVTLSTVWAAAPPSKAEPFSLARVRLLEGPFRDAMLRNGEYLMRLSPDRLLAKFRVEAGLDPKAESYGGWEGRDIAGHSLGHYLTGLSLAYAATGDPFFKQRVDYIVDELAACQARNPDKLVDAKTQRRPQVWRELARGEIRGVERHNINGAWVPWYAIHKVYAGLRDAWLYTGNSTAKTVFLNLADWTQTITGKLSEEQMQQMMACEFGGMNEVLADAYALSGKSAHLALARKFEHKAVMDPLAAQHDELAGLHANTQIPKIIGEARLYEVSGDERPRRISEFFFRTVLDRYTYANGGNSDKEWFGKPGAQSEHMSGQMTETCNTYNMLKLAVQLFSWEPRAFLMDYYERALWNQIYNSQDRKTGYVHVQARTLRRLVSAVLAPGRRFLVLRGKRHGKPQQVRRGHLLSSRRGSVGEPIHSLRTRLERAQNQSPADHQIPQREFVVAAYIDARPGALRDAPPLPAMGREGVRDPHQRESMEAWRQARRVCDHRPHLARRRHGIDFDALRASL